MSDEDPKLVKLYRTIRDALLQSTDFKAVVEWQATRDLSKVTEEDFLAEAAWVIFNGGMREAVIRSKWDDLRAAFLGFKAADVCHGEVQVRADALAVFNHPGKVDAVLSIARILLADGWGAVKESIDVSGPDYLETFPWVGPVTKYHLAKNLGFDCVKPDRHLTRMADLLDTDPTSMCRVINQHTGDKLCVVDLVLWRWASVDPTYLDVMRREVL